MAKLLMAMFGGMIVAFVLSYGGKIEGQLFPVMGQLEIRDPQKVEDGTVWSGEAAKKRNCNFVRTEWFLGPRHGRRVQVVIEYLDPPEVRTPGLLEWSGIFVELGERAMRNNSHADVLHQCYIGPVPLPWLTRTPFYDGGRE